MTFEEYQTACLRTLPSLPSRDILAMLALGTADEAGEVAGAIKKHLYQGHKMEDAQMLEEIGDVLWYLTNLCTFLGYDVAEVAARNVKKLWTRYPNGFDAQRSRVRLLETPDGLIGGVLVNAGPDLADEHNVEPDVIHYGTDTM